MRALLVIFRSDVSVEVVQRLTRELGATGWGEWALAFTDNGRVYSVQVEEDESDAWKSALQEIPEVACVEYIGRVRFVKEHSV